MDFKEEGGGRSIISAMQLASTGRHVVYMLHLVFICLHSFFISLNYFLRMTLRTRWSLPVSQHASSDILCCVQEKNNPQKSVGKQKNLWNAFKKIKKKKKNINKKLLLRCYYEIRLGPSLSCVRNCSPNGEGLSEWFILYVQKSEAMNFYDQLA